MVSEQSLKYFSNKAVKIAKLTLPPIPGRKIQFIQEITKIITTYMKVIPKIMFTTVQTRYF